MNKPEIYILTASNMPDCVATAAFANVAYGANVYLVEHTRKFQTEDDVRNTFVLNRYDSHLYVVGTFWKDSLTTFSKVFSKVYVYTFGEHVDNPFGDSFPPFIDIFRDIEKKGSIAWLNALLSTESIHTAFTNAKRHIVSKVNVRCFGEGNEEVQQLFTGVYNYATTGSKPGLFATFTKLFDSDNSFYEELMVQGSTLMQNHKGLADERARKNTKIVVLKCGAKAAVTEGPELINYTHEALVKANPEIDVTVVVRYQFDKNGPDDKMCYSLRSYNDQINANEIVQDIKGSGGSNKAAGCTVPVTFNMNF